MSGVRPARAARSPRASPPSAATPSARSTFVSVIAAIGPPITILTALLYYFGWTRTSAQASAMGLDVSLFGYSPQDYIIRSVNALYTPLVGALVASLLWLVIDRWLAALIKRAGKDGAWVARFTIIPIGIGILVAVGTLVFLIVEGRAVLFTPYLIAAGVLLAAWGVRLHRKIVAADGQTISIEQRATETTLVLALVTLLLFWGSADVAQGLGRRLALTYEGTVTELPRSAVYSSERLAIGVPNVHEEQIGTPESPEYRYTGLRLLVLSGGRFFFLHDGWNLATGTVIILPDDNKVRMEFGN